MVPSLSSSISSSFLLSLFFLPPIKCKEEAEDGGVGTSLFAESMLRTRYWMASAVEIPIVSGGWLDFLF